jgi:hypothetical protein
VPRGGEDALKSRGIGIHDAMRNNVPLMHLPEYTSIMNRSLLQVKVYLNIKQIVVQVRAAISATALAASFPTVLDRFCALGQSCDRSATRSVRSMSGALDVVQAVGFGLV